MNKQELKYSNFFKTDKYRPFILIVVFIFLAQDLLLELPVIFYKLRVGQLNGITKGDIEEINPKKILRQTLTGNKLIITGYEISFSFEVNGKKYQGESFVPNGTTQYVSTQKHLLETDKVTVKYQPDNPTNNSIELPYEDIFLSM